MKWPARGLVIALVGSNAWWLYASVDAGITATYREMDCTAHEEALDQSLAVIRLAKGRRVRQEMVAAAQAALPGLSEPFEKDGETIVGRLALKFDAEGALIDVQGP